jgi:ketosteroid isomerase-like protein
MIEREPVKDARARIADLVNSETKAWDTQDVELLLSILHPDMVWPWPPGASAHDPADWVLEWGRYDRERWKRGWQELFDTHDLMHNRRIIRRIEVAAENDGGFAVVDVDTLWRRRADDVPNNWSGRACKIYTRLARGEWKLIAQTGLLDYSLVRRGTTHRSHEVKDPFTKLQGRYLAFIDSYTRLNRRPPAEADMQRYFRVTPPAIHQMILTLEKRGLIARTPGQARSIQVLVARDQIPSLE